MIMENLMTPKEASVFLKLSLGTLANKRTQGSGPPFLKIGNGAVRYPETELRKYLGLSDGGDQ